MCDIGNLLYSSCSFIGLCARAGNVDEMQRAIEHGFKSDITDNRGWLPVHEAAFGNHTECIELLSSLGLIIDVNAKTHDGSTAVLLACQKGHLEALSLLLELGGDPNVSTTDRMTPLIAAIHPGHDRGCVKTLLSAGANVHAKYFNGWTALHEAACRGADDIVLDLLNEAADTFAVDDDGLSPAFVACQYGNSTALRLILTACTSPRELINLPTEDGATCLYIAAQEGYDKCIDMLLGYGADANKLTNDKIHPIVPAVKFNHSHCLSLLLKQASMDAINQSDVDPVYVAVEEKSNKCLEMLLSYGLSVNRETDYFVNFSIPVYPYLQPLVVKRKLTPLGMAVHRLNTELILNLLQHGAKAVGVSELCYSPLVCAIMKRKFPKVLSAMLQFGVDINSQCQSSCYSSADSGHSSYAVPSALLISLHPLYRQQRLLLLKCGLQPELHNWCGCCRPVSNGNRVTLLEEISVLLTQHELCELICDLLAYSKSGFPRCCDLWKLKLGSVYSSFLEERFPSLPSLQFLCRREVRRAVPHAKLFSDSWTDLLDLPHTLVQYLLYKKTDSAV